MIEDDTTQFIYGHKLSNCLVGFKFLFQNVHKSRKTTHDLLETHAGGTDFISIQEANFSLVRHTISTTSEEGDPVIGPVYHKAWECVQKLETYANTQVTIYVNKRILTTFSIFIDPHRIPHPNVLALDVSRIIDGVTSTIINLYNPPQSANSAVRHLIRALQSDDLSPAIIQGDFNLHHVEWEPEREQLNNSIAEELLEAITEKDMDLVNNNGDATWHHPDGRGSVLDLVLLRRDCINANCFVYTNDARGRGASDHSLLGVSFGHFDVREGNEYIAMETDEETAFVREVGEAILRCANGLSGENEKLEEECERLDVEVHGAWLRNCKKGKSGGNPTRWWMEECQIVKELYEAHRSRCNLKEYRATTRMVHNAFFEQKLKVMSATNRPWEALKWIRLRPLLSYSQIKRPDGTMISTQNELFDVLHGQFNKADALNTVDWTFINNLPSTPQRPDSAFSTKELWDVLSNTNNSSAPGTDHVTWRHIKLALITPEADVALTRIYNAIYDTGIWPKSFKETVSVVIPKPKKDDYSVPKAHRPIALLKTLGKLFTKMIAKRLQYDGIAHGLFHKGQFGGIQKHSTMDVGIVLMDMISEARDRGLFMTVLAVDIAQFFPSIQHNVMVKLLIKQGFSDKTANLIGSFFKD